MFLDIIPGYDAAELDNEQIVPSSIQNADNLPVTTAPLATQSGVRSAPVQEAGSNSLKYIIAIGVAYLLAR